MNFSLDPNLYFEVVLKKAFVKKFKKKKLHN